MVTQAAHIKTSRASIAPLGLPSGDTTETTAEAHGPGNADGIHESLFGNPPYQAECIDFWVALLQKCPSEYPHENQCNPNISPLTFACWL